MGDAVSKVVLTGGNARFPNFRNRFQSEFRPLVPDMFDISVRTVQL
jgi:actin-related protein